MYIAVYGPKGFAVNSNRILTFNELELGSTLETETQESTEKKPSTYIKGAGLDIFSIKIQLNSAFWVNPMYEIESWRQLKDNAKPYMFLLGGKPFMNAYWIVKSVNATETVIDAQGNITNALLTIGFEEFVKAGSAKSKQASTSKSTSKKSTKSTESIYNQLAPTQQVKKEELKRTAEVIAPSIKTGGYTYERM